MCLIALAWRAHPDFPLVVAATRDEWRARPAAPARWWDAHPAIQEVCVIAARDARRGETVKAVVVLREAFRGKVTEQEIADWAHDHMAAYKSPRLVQFVDALPKSGTGKVQWRALQDSEATSAP